MEPLISIVMPSYNHAHFIAKAIQSVIDQTYSNWELLIIDNHSQDTTDAVIEGFKDPRVRLLKIHNNGVIAASRNRGIREAKGEWIAFLDSDDCWYTAKIATAMEVLKTDNNYDVLSTNELMVDIRTGKSQVLQFGPYEKNFYKVLLMEGNRLSPSATMIRHTFLKKHALLFNESKDYIAVEDYDLWLNLANAGARFKFIDSVQGEYVIHQNNNSAQLLRQRKNFETLLRNHVFKVQAFDPNPAELWKQLEPMLSIQKIKQLWNDGFGGQAMMSALNALATDPFGICRYIFGKAKKRIVN